MNFSYNLYFTILFVAIGYTMAFSQQTIEATIVHDNITREYILYVPEIYDNQSAVPLVFNFHGYTSSAANQMRYGDFRKIADRDNFIIVHPMGTIGNDGQTYFNAQWRDDGVDDIGFTSALIDSISMNWNIDLDRVYSTGMSNGGFMSYTLACELSDRIAAIASVTGTCTIDQLDNTCMPQKLVPIMEIHGTADAVVPYNGNTWMAPIDRVIDFWVTLNECEVSPHFTAIDDSDTTDGSTVEHYLYKNGKEGHEIEHYKIIGGGHTWPGASFGRSNKDIDASELVWEFFSKYDINGRRLTNNQNVHNNTNLLIYPNPSLGSITIENADSPITKITIVDLTGKVFLESSFSSNKVVLDFKAPEGLYLVKVKSESSLRAEKLMIRG